MQEHAGYVSSSYVKKDMLSGQYFFYNVLYIILTKLILKSF